MVIYPFNTFFLKNAAPKRKTSRSSAHNEDQSEQPTLIDTVYGKKDTNTATLSVANGNVSTETKKKVTVKKKKGAMSLF